MSSTIIQTPLKAIIVAATAALLCISAAGSSLSQSKACKNAEKTESDDEDAVILDCFSKNKKAKKQNCAQDKTDVCHWLDEVKKTCGGTLYVKGTHTGIYKEHYCAAACNKGQYKDTANPGTVCD